MDQGTLPVVVFAPPGKRNAEDTKVMDALIKYYYRDYVAGNDISKIRTDYWTLCRYD